MLSWKQVIFSRQGSSGCGGVAVVSGVCSPEDAGSLSLVSSAAEAGTEEADAEDEEAEEEEVETEIEALTTESLDGDEEGKDAGVDDNDNDDEDEDEDEEADGTDVKAVAAVAADATSALSVSITTGCVSWLAAAGIVAIADADDIGNEADDAPSALVLLLELLSLAFTGAGACFDSLPPPLA